MNEDFSRTVCRLVVVLMATAKLADWLGPTVPFEGWGWALAMTGCVIVAGLVMLAAISEPTRHG